MGALAAAGLALPTYEKNGKKLNVLMIVTDQEQSVASYPKGLLEKLPAHRELMEREMLVENYHVITKPCSSSHWTFFAGHQPPQPGSITNRAYAPHPLIAHILDAYCPD